MGALKKPVCPAEKPAEVKKDNQIAKAEIDRMKRLLSDKIKDPKLAKKAAMIISEMLDKKS